jgi:hypothetical protein
MKKNAKSALKWSFHSPDLGVSMVRIIHSIDEIAEMIMKKLKTIKLRPIIE